MLKKKNLGRIIPLLAVLTLTACGGKDTPEKEQDPCAGDPVYSGEEIDVSRIAHNDHGFNISVENKDFLFMGSQIRVDAFMNCDKYSYADIRNLFQEASKLGVTCVQIPIEWSKVEVEKDKYDFKYAHEMLRYANEFNLKVEFLWFGSNMCGDTHSYSVPNYILADGKTYPKFDATRTGEFWNYYGIMWFLDFENENLIERETKAIRQLMEYVYQFDSTHGAKKPLIGVQIENEADIFPRFRIDQQTVLDPVTGQKMTYEAGFRRVYKLLNEVGKEVKKAKYKVYTRTNLAASTGNVIYSGDNVLPPPDFAKAIAALDGIDIVGDDSYTSSVKNIKGLASMFSTIDNNFSHIAENDGSYGNSPSLILASTSQHGGYSLYDLMTSPFYIKHGSGSVNQGIINPGEDRSTFTYTEHYSETQNIIKGLKKVASELYTLSHDDFIGFNIKNDYPSKSINQSISSTNATINFKTDDKAIGFALDFGTYMDVYFTHNSSLSMSNGTISKVEKGNINENKEFVGENVSFSETLNVEGGELYRISYTSDGKIPSTTWNFIG